jgi:aqualysin 1
MRIPIVRTLPLLIVAGVAVAGCRDVPTAPATPDASVETVAPLLAAAPGNGIRDRYIVVLRNGTQNVPGLAKRLVATHGGLLHHTYQHALRGFAATLPAAAVDAVRRNPNVAYVEQDGIATATATQYNAPWGLDRIDQPDLPLNGTYNYYLNGGAKVYILDTGIRFDHVEFGGRAYAGFDGYGGNASDCNGHGTHVAGTVGGSTYGVAKNVSLVSVRVMGCDGWGEWSTIIAGVDWVTANHPNSYNPFRPWEWVPAVANMSLGGGANTSVDQAVANSIAQGVTYVIAAGNSGIDACSVSPARVSAAITVGATDLSDGRAFFPLGGSSNYGTCLDVFAPGLNIPSAWHTSSTATLTISGTSMAAPHVAGVAALYLSKYQTATPASVESAIVNAAFMNKLSNVGAGSPNRLLNALAYVSSSPLSVTLSCFNGSFGRSCYAYPSGGTGSYSYEWVGATDSYDEPDRSTATPSCPVGYSGSIQVSVTVRDGIGEAYAETWFSCG